MKILMVITGMKSGGAERVMATLCNELSKRNQVRLLVLKNKESDYEISDRIEFIAGNIKRQNVFQSVDFVKEQIEEWKPNVVLSFMTKTNIIAIIAKEKAEVKTKLVIAERANLYNAKFYLKLVRKFLYRKVDGCVFQTKLAQEYYSNILNCSSRVIRNPLTPEFKVEQFEGNRTEKIVCTGRLSIEKNQKLLIDSFLLISKKYPQINVEIYGEGPLHKKLQKYINRLGLSKRVRLMGRKDNIQDYIKDAKIFILPSNSEGMPNALLEAMALGIPSIATDCPIGGPKEIIVNEENGILIPMNNKEELAKAIDKIITNEEFSNKISRNARNVINDFETVKVCSEWEEYLKKIANI